MEWGVSSSSSSAIASHSSSDTRPSRKLSAAACASFSFCPLELIATDGLLEVSLIREVMALAICTIRILKSMNNISGSGKLKAYRIGVAMGRLPLADKPSIINAKGMEADVVKIKNK